MELKDLAVKHDYYCSESNFYSNDPYECFDSWKDFYEEYFDADIDMNLIFRWDLYKNEDGCFWLNIFMIQQRKGIFKPIVVKKIEEDDVDLAVEFFNKHWKKLKKIWSPISKSRRTK